MVTYDVSGFHENNTNHNYRAILSSLGIRRVYVDETLEWRNG